ncbi:6639_t:CDS:2 [Diversispora eburnea]|uniref:6639_t:CDS:1 n=1 Tax=Diversispora eburnea TaxID=1213867 RepID=A0A9N8YVW6_9GLOM|nr:6639_t:CDS:2 [Diversispora eburnea]
MKKAIKKRIKSLPTSLYKDKKHKNKSRSPGDEKESSSTSNRSSSDSNSSASVNEKSTIKSSEESNDEHTNGVDESFDEPISPEDKSDTGDKENEAPAETTWPQKSETSAETSRSQENETPTETSWPQESEINAKDVPLPTFKFQESKINPYNETTTYDFRLREVKKPTSIKQSQSSELVYPELSIAKLGIIDLAIYWFGWYSEDFFIRTADKIKIVDGITGLPVSDWFFWLFSLKSWLNIHD